jgi:hypothetical protein
VGSVVDGGRPVIRFMMVAEGALVLLVVGVVVVGVVEPVAVQADAKVGRVIVAAVGIGTCGAGRFMILAKGGKGSRGGSAGISRGKIGDMACSGCVSAGGARNGSSGGSAVDTRDSGGRSAGGSSNGSSGGEAGDTTGAGGTSADNL